MSGNGNGNGNGHANCPAARPMPLIRVAVVGLGYWGPNLVRNLHELPDAELVAVCDMRERRARDDRAALPGRHDHDARFDDVARATTASTRS